MSNLKKIKELNLVNKIYKKYILTNLPIEIIVNTCLLLKGSRKIIQFDKYVYTKSIWNMIKRFCQDKLIIDYIYCINDLKGNIIMYIKNEKIKNLIESEGLYSNKFGKLLDTKFYKCNFKNVYTRKNLVKVSINVIGPVSGNLKNGFIQKKTNNIGSILIQMCSEKDITKYITKIYQRFYEYQKMIWSIDKKLQLSLDYTVKNGLFRNQPSFLTKKLKRVI